MGRAFDVAFQDADTLVIRIQKFPDNDVFYSKDTNLKTEFFRTLELEHTRGREHILYITSAHLLDEQPTDALCPTCRKPLYWNSTGVC